MKVRKIEIDRNINASINILKCGLKELGMNLPNSIKLSLSSDNQTR
jgi:hypothetical protein